MGTSSTPPTGGMEELKMTDEERRYLSEVFRPLVKGMASLEVFTKTLPDFEWTPCRAEAMSHIIKTLREKAEALERTVNQQRCPRIIQWDDI
jgi:hypothetical protein